MIYVVNIKPNNEGFNIKKLKGLSEYEYESGDVVICNSKLELFETLNAYYPNLAKLVF